MPRRPTAASTFVAFPAVVAAWVLGTAGGCNRPDAPATRPVPPARPAAVPTTKPVPAVERAVVVSIDGLRPDLVLRSGAVCLSGLLDRGSFSLWARAADLPYTLPSHVSMLTGVSPARHQVTFNGSSSGVYPAFPTLFEAAKAHGLTTAFVAGKAKMAVLARPGSLDWQFVRDADCGEVADRAVGFVRAHRPGLLVVHFRECDAAGHASGWGSPEQLAAVRLVDDALGRVLAAVAADGPADAAFVVVTADHGGAAGGHGPDARGSTIPWIAVGPGVRPGFDLDQARDAPVRTEDTFATVGLMLGLPARPDVDGRPVYEMLMPPAGGEMLRDAR